MPVSELGRGRGVFFVRPVRTDLKQREEKKEEDCLRSIETGLHVERVSTGGECNS